MRVTRKQTLSPSSLSYHARPSFFWHDTDFSEFDSADIIDYILEKSVSCQRQRPYGLFSRDACHNMVCIIWQIIYYSPLICFYLALTMSMTMSITVTVHGLISRTHSVRYLLKGGYGYWDQSLTKNIVFYLRTVLECGTKW